MGRSPRSLPTGSVPAMALIQPATRGRQYARELLRREAVAQLLGAGRTPSARCTSSRRAGPSDPRPQPVAGGIRRDLGREPRRRPDRSSRARAARRHLAHGRVSARPRKLADRLASSAATSRSSRSPTRSTRRSASTTTATRACSGSTRASIWTSSSRSAVAERRRVAGRMTEHPIFVPTGDGHVAAVITVPDAPRAARPAARRDGPAQRDRLDALGALSVELAGHGLASARLDYGGSATAPVWSIAGARATTRPRPRRRAPCSTSRAGVGVERFASVGTCYGSRVALSLVEDPGCIGAVCLAPPILDFSGVASAGAACASAASVAVLPRARRCGGWSSSRCARCVRARKPAPRVVGALAHLERAPLLSLRRAQPAGGSLQRARCPGGGVTVAGLARPSCASGSSCSCSPAAR